MWWRGIVLIAQVLAEIWHEHRRARRARPKG